MSRLTNVLGPLIGLAFVIGLFCISSEVRPYFLTGGNFKIIFTQSVIVSIAALGMTMIIVSGGIDLSAGAAIALTSDICAIILAHNLTPALAVVGALFGLAGVMQLSRLTQGDPSTANGLELDIIAAVVIGGASLNGGVGSIPGSLIGALIMAVLRNGSSQMGWPTYVQQIIIGGVI